MKAIVINQFGDTTVFEKKEVPTPQIKAGHLLIKVASSSVNPVDTKIRAGFSVSLAPSFPNAILHGDVAGVVAEVGDGVDTFQVGDEVYACAGGIKGRGGALAEFMLADARLVALKPQSLSLEKAATLPLVAITAWEGLFDKARICPGQNVLVHGATGGVGQIAIQIAKLAGTRVFTTGSSDKKLEIAKSLGADVGINYKTTSVEDYVNEHTGGRGFDVVFDTVGQENLDRSFQAAAPKGSVVGIAARSTHDLSPCHMKSLSVHIELMLIPMIHGIDLESHGKILSRVAKLVDEGRIQSLIDDQVFPFSEAGAAHAKLEAGDAIGKIALVNDL